MNTADILDLYEYNRWAAERTFDAAQALSNDDYVRTMPGSFASLRAILEHILSVEVIWLSRWEGHSLGDAPDYAGCHEAASLARLSKAFWTRQFRYLNALSDDDLTSPIAIRTRSGIETVQPLSETLLHVVNHATYHRGQAATLIRQLGGAPQGTDYFTYCLVRGLKAPDAELTS
jgi:uncharacterized damage-inducible protein DinB